MPFYMKVVTYTTPPLTLFNFTSGWSLGVTTSFTNGARSNYSENSTWEAIPLYMQFLVHAVQKNWYLFALYTGNISILRKCQYEPGWRSSISLRTYFFFFLLFLLMYYSSEGGKTTTTSNNVWIGISCKYAFFIFYLGFHILWSSSTSSLWSRGATPRIWKILNSLNWEFNGSYVLITS